MIVVDTHVHLYPQYTLASMLAHAESNVLSAVGEDHLRPAQILLCVCDRVGYPTLREILRQIGHEHSDLDEDLAQLVMFEGREVQIGLVESKQWAAKQGFEVLGLGSALNLPDGLRAEEYIRAIRAEGATAVLPWSPGKWMFRRAKLLHEVLELFAPNELFLGDIYLRPAFTARPMAMAKFHSRGGKILYGSDPLPVVGEEAIAGRYTSIYERPAVNTADAAALLLRTVEAKPLGLRAGIPTFVRRTIAALQSKNGSTRKNEFRM